MNPCVIYNQDNGIPVVLYPSKEALDAYGIMAIAIKDVPAGKRFKIIDADQLPQDAPQKAWRIDEALLTDGVGGFSNEFQSQLAE
jgi:hypothetical protein